MNKFRRLLYLNSDLLLFTALLFIKAVFFNNSMDLMKQDVQLMMIGCLGSVLIIVSFGSIIAKNNRIFFFLAVDILLSAIFITDTVYNRYFHDVTSVALIKQAALVGEVQSSVEALIHPSDFLYFADIVALIPLYFLYKKRLDFSVRFSLKSKCAAFASIFVAGFFLSHISIYALEKQQPGLLNTFYDKKYVVQEIGNINYHAFDIYNYVSNTVFKVDRLSEDEKQEIKEWYDEKNQSSGTRYKNIMAGKNLIIVQMEAFQGFVLGRSVNGQEITPNLNKLSNDSLVFDNYYYQISKGGTSDAEFLSNISLLPARDGSVYYQYASNTYDSIVKKLKDKGYYTAVMHANRPGFWNRAQMYADIGFDKYENENDFNIDQIYGLGLSDKSFLKQTVEKMKGYQQPFYSFLITLSSHFPFTDDHEGYNEILNTGEFEGKLMGNYLKSVKYTDQAIGDFVAELKAQGLWDNSVVVFYGDHSAIPQENRDQLAKLMYGRDTMSDLEWQNAQKVVMMVHFPGNKIKGHSSMTAGQMDLYPTVANLFGVDAKYSMGRDLLNSKDGFVVTRDGVWANNNVIYIKNADKVFDIKTGKELNKNDYAQYFAAADEYLKNSDATIENDLICYFEENNGNDNPN